jgi:hypothetical protein
MIIAYLMVANSMSLAEAYKFVASVRPQIRPNDGFWEQLKVLLGTGMSHEN